VVFAVAGPAEAEILLFVFCREGASGTAFAMLAHDHVRGLTAIPADVEEGGAHRAIALVFAELVFGLPFGAQLALPW
jgi:hypothetical protein